MKIIDPKFYKKPPKEWENWLHRGYKSDYMLNHPKASIVFGIIAIALFLLPVVMLIYTYIIFTRAGNEPFGPLAGLGIIGSILIGTGLSNLIMAFVQQYLGHVFTLTVILLGSFILAVTFYFILL